jgi:hypothetical protein
MGLMTIFYCLRFEAPPDWRVRSPYSYPPGTGWASYTPRHWVLFSSPPATRRAAGGIREEKREKRRKWGGRERRYIWGGGGRKKVPKQCPLVLLVEVMYKIGINLLYDLGRAPLY